MTELIRFKVLLSAPPFVQLNSVSNPHLPTYLPTFLTIKTEQKNERCWTEHDFCKTKKKSGMWIVTSTIAETGTHTLPPTADSCWCDEWKKPIKIVKHDASCSSFSLVPPKVQTVLAIIIIIIISRAVISSPDFCSVSLSLGRSCKAKRFLYRVYQGSWEFWHPHFSVSRIFHMFQNWSQS